MANTVRDTAPKATQDSKGELNEHHKGGTHVFMGGLCKHMQSFCSKWKAKLCWPLKEWVWFWYFWGFWLGFFGVHFTEYRHTQFLLFLMQRCLTNLHV